MSIYKERDYWRVAKLVVCFMVIGTCVLVFPLQKVVAPPSPVEWVGIKNWKGEGSTTTEKFMITPEGYDSWRIRAKIISSQYDDPTLFISLKNVKGQTVKTMSFKLGDALNYIHEGGTYYMEIRGNYTIWEVIVEELKPRKTIILRDEISLSNFGLRDRAGAAVTSVSVGQQVVLQSSMKNEQALDQAFAYIMQIKDTGGATVMIAWVNGEIPSNKTFDIGLSWIPESKGSYNVDIFVWQSIGYPETLSKPLSKTITVL